MLERLLRFSVAHRWFVVLATVALAAIGAHSLLRLPIDAIPDITNRQVVINTLDPSLSPTEVEKQVTFVVETAGFHPESAWRNASEHMHVTERITRVDDDTLEYAFTVTDPDTWAEPWGGVYPLTKLDGLLYEYACTEGNYGMANILSGARTAEKEAAAKP